MARIDQYSRILHHRLTSPGAVFTIPSSSDHTDETWAATDLYIGELGINVTDDKIFMRTNNGIVQLATATASAGGANIWVYSGTEVQIGNSYSVATAITKASTATQSVDLGTTSKRFSNLYLGDNSDNKAVINVKDTFTLKNNAGDFLLTSGYLINSENSAIHIGTQSSTVSKTNPVWINTSGGTVSNGGYRHSVISSGNVVIDDVESAVAINAENVTIGDTNLGTLGLTTHIGYGYNKKNITGFQTVIGGSLAIRTLDSGTLGGNSEPIYANSDWTTQQAKIQTLNALSTSIVTMGWTAGEAIQMKAWVMGVNRDDGNVYSAEVFGTGIHNGDGFAKMVGDVYVLEQSTFGGTASMPPYDLAESTIECDDISFYIKVKGHSSSTVEWITTYSYQKMQNLFQ